jgi:hypothetical protein
MGGRGSGVELGVGTFSSSFGSAGDACPLLMMEKVSHRSILEAADGEDSLTRLSSLSQYSDISTGKLEPLSDLTDVTKENVRALSAPAGSLFMDDVSNRQPRRLLPLADKSLEKFLLLPPDRHLSKLWPHPLKRVNPLVVYQHLNGGWACDECGTRDGKSMYHCFRTGDFDLCEMCVAKGRGFIENGVTDNEPLPALPNDAKAAPGQGRRARLAHYEHGVLPRQEFFSLFRSSEKKQSDLEVRKTTSKQPVKKVTDDYENSENPARAKLAKIYRQMDSDYSDSVNKRELWEGLAAAGIGIARDEVDALLEMADEDKYLPPTPPHATPPHPTPPHPHTKYLTPTAAVVYARSPEVQLPPDPLPRAQVRRAIHGRVPGRVREQGALDRRRRLAAGGPGPPPPAPFCTSALRNALLWQKTV